MALVLADRVKETTTTTGTGTYTLAGAVTGFESFATIGNTNTTYYCCTDGTDFEVGVGTYTSSGTTLARTTILQSSNSDSAVNWSAGTRSIFCTQPAEKAFFLDADGVGRTETLELAGGITYDPPGSSGTDTATDVAIALLSTQRIALGHLGYIRTSVDAEWGAALQIGQSGTSAFVDTKIYGGATAVKLHYNSTEKLATTSDGVSVSGDVTLTDTDTSDAAGPLLTIRRDSSSPADNDLLGRIEFKGENDAGQSFDYATITAKLLDNTDGTEDGGLILSVGQAGSSVQGRISMQGYGDTVFQNKDVRLSTGLNLKFEGATDDAHETTLTVVDPTGDRTITLPDATGTVQLTDGSGASLTSLNASELGSGTVPNARLDAQLQDVAGLAVTNGNFIVGDGSNFVAESGATARTSLGLGTAAVAATGISNTNVPVFTSGVADDDFLRVNGTSIEGRSASEVASDIGAATTDDATALAIALG